MRRSRRDRCARAARRGNDPSSRSAPQPGRDAGSTPAAPGRTRRRRPSARRPRQSERRHQQGRAERDDERADWSRHFGAGDGRHRQHERADDVIGVGHAAFGTERQPREQQPDADRRWRPPGPWQARRRRPPSSRMICAGRALELARRRPSAPSSVSPTKQHAQQAARPCAAAQELERRESSSSE